MITEDYVDFETAKLLKEKGFDEPCRTYYQDGKFVDDVCTQYYQWNSKSPFGHISAPTHQMTMKWLREVHGLFITIYPNYGTEKIAWSVHQRDYDMNWVTIKHNYADYYEEACEAALHYTLENLI